MPDIRDPALPDLRFWRGARVPFILQTEAGECGLACLAMVAGHWGHRVDLASLRRRFSVSLKGATLKSLISMANAMSLQARPLKVELDKLQSLALPCILHWNMSHFVVLVAIDRKGVVIHDPAIGRRRMPLSDVSRHFTGIALELTPSSQFRRIEETRRLGLRDIMGRVVGLKRGLCQILLIGVAMQACSLVLPFYLQWVVDEAIVAADHNLVTVLGTGFLLLVAMQTIMSAFRSWAATALATSLNFQWFGNAFDHLMKLPLLYFEKRHLGDIVSRFGSIQTIQRSLTTQFVDGIIDGLLVIGTFIVMALYSLSLTAVAAAAVALYVLLRSSMFSSLRDATSEQIVHAARQQSHFMESARGVQSIRLFNRAPERRIGWMNALADQFNADLRISRLAISYQTANTFLFGSERIIVVWMAALAVLDGHFSVGMLLAYLSYKDQFTQRLAALVDKLFELRMLRLHLDRLADLMLTEPEKDPADVEFDVEGIAPSIELRNVSFRYADGEPDVIKGLNLSIAAGECVALAGASGCGKTTLVKLMLGLVEPTEGDILIGGIKLDTLGLANYRQLTGTVMQEDHLFAGSVGDNICFFDPAPVHERIRSSARLAAIDDEIMAMPMGYETLVGDIGTGLSGGQKQRILLARALYKMPRMLYLDEATSHLDVGNEQLVNAAIRGIMLTRIIVAHRPETIAMAQRVIVLERGQIVRDLEQSSGAPSMLAMRVPSSANGTAVRAD